MATTTVNTKNKNFYGTYEGTLPCADCSGIRTTLKINSDTTYELRSEYLGRKDGVFEESGIYNIVGENIIELVLLLPGRRHSIKFSMVQSRCPTVWERSTAVNWLNIIF